MFCVEIGLYSGVQCQTSSPLWLGGALSLATSLPGHLMTPLHDIASQQSTVQEGSRLSVHYGIIGVQVTAMLVMLPNLP